MNNARCVVIGCCIVSFLCCQVEEIKSPGRHNIRKIFTNKKITLETKIAAQEEKDRRKRLKEAKVSVMCSYCFAAFEKGAKSYWSRPWFRLDETFGFCYPQPPPCHGCYPNCWKKCYPHHQRVSPRQSVPHHWMLPTPKHRCNSPTKLLPAPSDFSPPQRCMVAAKYLAFIAKFLVSIGIIIHVY